MTLAPGTTLGRYQILEPLGSGGMASVYRAYQPALDRVVALKLLRPTLADDAEFRSRFEREAKAVARLRHPHIVQVFDFEQEGALAFIVMEFVSGGTLKARLTQLEQEGQQLPILEVSRIVSEVADALGYAHAQGIVHRDIKPSNILLTTDGKAVVSDFGIARLLSGAGQTATGVGLGTPEYMSPEQGQGQPVDQRSDVYSLGVLAYELLTGGVPYRADTPFAVVLAHVRDPLPLPSSRSDRVGPATERALLRALAKDPGQRFATAPEFTLALARAVAEDGRATGSTRVGAPAPRPARFPIRLRLVAALAAAALVVILGGATLISGALGTRTEPAPGAQSTATTTVAPIAASPVSVASGQPPPTTPQTTATLPPTATSAAAPTLITPGPSPATVAPVLPPAPTATLPPPPTQPPTPTFDPTAPRFQLNGRLLSAATGAGVSAHVSLYLSGRCCPEVASATSDTQGNYSFSAPNGTYRITAIPSTASGYVNAFWPAAISDGTATDIVVSGSNLTGLDVTLRTGFLAGGTIATAGGAGRAAGVHVTLPGEGHVAFTTSDASGRYTVRLANSPYTFEFYTQVSNCCTIPPFATANVNVAGADVSGVDATYP